MENIVIAKEKIKDDDSLKLEDLLSLGECEVLKNNSEAKSLLEHIQNSRTVKIIGIHHKSPILHHLLEDNNISVSDYGTVEILLNDTDDDIECDKYDVIVMDGLEKFIMAQSNIEPLHIYTSKVSEEKQCKKNSIAISLELVKVLQDKESDVWEERFDERGSHNPERDIEEYSNTRELLNHLSLEFKKKEKANYKKLGKLLDLIIQDNGNIEDIKAIRAKYRSENNYKKIYQQKRQLLIDIAKNLSETLQNESVVKTMQEVADRLEKQEFSIGVTGIIKAGKSTMMNALLGQDILGTAIRPETANLTTIKKSDDSKAIVHFWSKEEWLDIKNSAFDEQSKEFVKISEELENFDNYVENEPKQLNIDIDALDNYTSARQSNNLCNLVKEVELLLPLEFLDGGVAMVDTPGIDDPIAQREIITLEYLGSCSAILHLMNAKQSATQKDIEFIGDALIDQGISSLLVVITRIDTLGSNKQEIDSRLAEIITHAKSNLEIYLNKRSKDDISDILAKLEFLPLAGKFALQHRTGNSAKALKKGYKLEDTGILEIENYLNSMLFGEKNERAKLAIGNACRTINQNAEEYNKRLEENLSLVGLEKAELDEKLHSIKVEKEQITQKLDGILEEVEREESMIKKSLGEMKNTFEVKFAHLRKTFIEKISTYMQDKLFEGEKPNEEEIKLYVETELKEFVLEMTQWYQKEAQRRLEDSVDYMDTQYSKLELPTNIDIDMKIDKIDVMGDAAYTAIMFGLGGALGYAGAFLLGPLGVIGVFFINWWAGDSIDKWRGDKIKAEVDKKMIDLDKKLTQMNDKIHKSMIEELEKYDEAIISYFKNIATQPAQDLKKVMSEKETTLEELNTNLISREKSDEELRQTLSKEIKVIIQNLERLKGV